MKGSPKLAGILMSFLIAIGMSFVMSFAMLAINVGFVNNFMPMWMTGWGVGFAVGFPTAAIIVPFSRRIVSKITGIQMGSGKPQRNGAVKNQGQTYTFDKMS
jgi:ABC-type transport system involved in multi-copper enzyme maturation permease subunit